MDFAGGIEVYNILNDGDNTSALYGSRPSPLTTLTHYYMCQMSLHFGVRAQNSIHVPKVSATSGGSPITAGLAIPICHSYTMVGLPPKVYASADTSPPLKP